MKLNDKVCKNTKGKEKPYRLADGEGMYLEVRPNGSRLWRLKYRINGKEKRLSFGVYPVVSLAEARDKRIDAKKLLANGVDPSAFKKEVERKEQINNNNTFEVVARDWWEMKKSGWTESHAGYTIRRLEHNIFPEIGHLPINDIEPPALLDALKKTQERGANEVAFRCKSICGQIFRYAIVKGMGTRDPSQDLQEALSPYKKKHYHALEPKDIPEFIQTLERNDARLFPHTKLAVELMMLTFVRTSELIKSTWDEFDIDRKVWEIPAERMKMNRPHIVPLSTRTIEILKELKNLSCSGNNYLFPSKTNAHKHMSNNTILQAIGRLGYKGRMTGHGFRALAMTTIMQELGYRYEIPDLQLAHAKKAGVVAAYDRTSFIKERTKMMQEWDDYLAEAKVSGKVIKANFS
jgi:integrase